MAQTEKMAALILAVQATLKHTPMHVMRKMEKHAEKRALPKHTTRSDMGSTVSPFCSRKGDYYSSFGVQIYRYAEEHGDIRRELQRL